MKHREYPEFISTILSTHNKYWDAQKIQLQMLNDAYMNRFFENKTAFPGTMIQIEVPEAYSFIEGTIGSLFMNAPGVEISSDISDTTSNADAAEALANRFLQKKRNIIEDATRLALILPNSFLKLAPYATTDPLESVQLCAVEPWNIIVDQDAYDWSTQRFCGHIYWIPMSEAQEKFPSRKFTGVKKGEYLKTQGYSSNATSMSGLPQEFQYVCIVEFYDMVNDKLVFYCNQADKNVMSIEDIPLRTWNGLPLTGIVPLYFSSNPSRPLEGYSSLTRIYDQVAEKNYARTRMANSIRREARQFLYQKDKIDDQALAGISTGQDGLMIPCESDNLSSLIQPISNPSVNQDQSIYLMEIQSDLDRASMLPAFARGEATDSTATQSVLLQSYASSNIGRLARHRDTAVENLVNVYLRMLIIQLSDEQISPVIQVNDQPTIVTPEILSGKLNIQVVDGASSPFESLEKKQNLISSVGLLLSLGADPQAVLEELVSVMKLPARLAKPKTTDIRTSPAAPLSQEAISHILPDRGVK